MKPTIVRVVVSLLFVTIAVSVGIGPAPSARGDDTFIRGDANQDGVVSLSDLVFIDRWLFGNYGPSGPQPACLATADLNDNKNLNICDMVAILYGVMIEPDWAFLPPAPFPEPGPETDVEHAASVTLPVCSEEGGPIPEAMVGCASYAMQPAETSDDLIALGDVVGAPGKEVKIPVYLTPRIPVTAAQIVVQYDPMILDISTDPLVSLSFEGTYYEQLFGKEYTIPEDSGGSSTIHYHRDSMVALLTPRPSAGLFTAAIGGHLIYEGFEVPPGPETLIAWIHATISPDAPPETVVSLSPTNGLDGQGVGPYRMRNEITFDGGARYLSFLPKTEPGILRIVGDITFFIRGDSNRDEAINISDPIHILSFLFLGGTTLSCPDAADADDNGAVEITDAIALLNFLFLGAASLPPPYPEAGTDPSPDQVGGCGA